MRKYSIYVQYIKGNGSLIDIVMSKQAIELARTPVYRATVDSFINKFHVTR